MILLASTQPFVKGYVNPESLWLLMLIMEAWLNLTGCTFNGDQHVFDKRSSSCIQGRLQPHVMSASFFLPNHNWRHLGSTSSSFRMKVVFSP